MAAITFRWLNADKTIAVKIYPVEWTWEEFHAGNYAARELLQEVSHPVVWIIETHHIRVPAGGALSHAIHELKSEVPHLSLMIVVLSSPFVRSITSLVIQSAQHVLHYPIVTASSRAEAMKMAAAHLSDLQQKPV
jgi:hypothetical protein